MSICKFELLYTFIKMLVTTNDISLFLKDLIYDKYIHHLIDDVIYESIVLCHRRWHDAVNTWIWECEHTNVDMVDALRETYKLLTDYTMFNNDVSIITSEILRMTKCTSDFNIVDGNGTVYTIALYATPIKNIYEFALNAKNNIMVLRLNEEPTYC